MNTREQMSHKQLYAICRKKQKAIQKRIDKYFQEFDDLQDAMSKRCYKESFFYIYEEFTREKYRRIKKRAVKFKTGNYIQDRSAALDYCQHRRQVLATVKCRLKYYNQVLLVHSESNLKYLIAGAPFMENLYGLAHEAFYFPNKSMEIVESNHYAQNTFRSNGRQLYFPGFSAQNTDLLGVHKPEVFASHLDITIEYTYENAINTSKEQFIKEIAAFEKRNNQ
jgi:hypothetical protein